MFIALYPDLSLGVLPNEDEYKKIQEFKMQLSNAYGEARLIFVDDSVIIGQLAKIQDKFFELNAKERNLIIAQKNGGFCSLCGGVGRSLSSGFLLFPG